MILIAARLAYRINKSSITISDNGSTKSVDKPFNQLGKKSILGFFYKIDSLHILTLELSPYWRLKAAPTCKINFLGPNIPVSSSDIQFRFALCSPSGSDAALSEAISKSAFHSLSSVFSPLSSVC